MLLLLTFFVFLWYLRSHKIDDSFIYTTYFADTDGDNFGDIDYQPIVIATPQIKHINLDNENGYIILGCDGLWDTISNHSEMIQFIDEKLNESRINNIAEHLVKRSRDNGSSDNITAIFTFLPLFIIKNFI